MRPGRIAVGGLALLLVLARPVRAGECERPCQGDFACEREVAECLIAAERADAAIARLKERIAAQPDRPALKHLLARAYHAAGNAFWAVRTLRAAIDADPADCQARAWLAWIQLGQGDLDLARESLSAEACPETQADRARWALLLSAIAQAGEDRETEVRLFEEVENFDQVYPEDGRRYGRLLSAYRPDWIEPIHLRAELSLGYTSNVSAGLPTTEKGADIGSPMLRLDLSTRFVWPLWRSVKPALELAGKLHYLDDFKYGDDVDVDVRLANYFDGSLRVGLQLFFANMHAFVGYRGDLFVLNSPDAYQSAPLPFFEANRLDLELQPGAGFTVFAGAGRREFRQTSRSRTEVDGGVGRSMVLLDRLQLLVALSLRYYRADGSLYDQFGGSALLVGRVGLPAGLMLRAGLTAGLDYYPNAPLETSNASSGRDLLVKPSLSLWSPSWDGVRLGLAYEYAWRDSTAQVSFSYTEHRTMLQLRWTFGANPWAPDIHEPGGRVPLPWGGGSGSGWDEERIQDLLRQDEAARRGSSCVN